MMGLLQMFSCRRESLTFAVKVYVLIVIAVVVLWTGTFLGSNNNTTPAPDSSIAKAAQRSGHSYNEMIHPNDMKSIMRSRMHALKSGCGKLAMNGSDFHTITKSQLDHIVVDDKYKVLYCYVPKVACTNLKRVFLMLTGKMNVTNPLELKSADVHSHLDEYLTYLDTFNPTEIKYKLSHYKKVVFVREPLERVLSAFRNKFVQKGNDYFKKRFGRLIISKYRENADERSLNTGHDLKFYEFLQYLVDKKMKSIDFNEHWRPFYDLCHPCHIHYNYIGKYETIDEDVNGLLKLLKVDDLIQFPERGDSYKTLKTEDLVAKFYKEIHSGLISETVDIFQKDFDLFEYDLPTSIKKLLKAM